MALATTATALQWWQRHADLKGEQWANYYWRDWEAPHRRHIVVALSLLGPVASLYEIGCNSGPNLRLIRRYLPHITIGGLEGVKVAADLAAHNLDCPIDWGLLPDALPETAWDVVLSCYTLAYLDPKDAALAVARLSRMAQLALILIEPFAVGTLLLGQCRDDGLPEWRHDYERMFGTQGWHVAWKWPLIPPVQHMNVAAVFTR